VGTKRSRALQGYLKSQRNENKRPSGRVFWGKERGKRERTESDARGWKTSPGKIVTLLPTSREGGGGMGLETRGGEKPRSGGCTGSSLKLGIGGLGDYEPGGRNGCWSP